MVDFLARFYCFATRLSFWNGMKWSDRISGGSRRNDSARKSFIIHQPLVVAEQKVLRFVIVYFLAVIIQPQRTGSNGRADGRPNNPDMYFYVFAEFFK